MFDPLNLLEPYPFSFSNGSDNRSADEYLNVIQQFNVDTNYRYQPKGGMTFCSTFLWDVSRAFAAEIPHWVLGHEENANAMVDWLDTKGPDNGWAKVPDLHTATASSSQGLPTVVMWKNPNGGHGHCAFLLPNGNIAQAGLTCFYDKPIANGFGNLPVSFYVHS